MYYNTKNKIFQGFTSHYNLTKLVRYESFNDIHEAIESEKKIKAWRRQKRVVLIEKPNPKWLDLAENWYPTEPRATMNPDSSVAKAPSE